MCRITTTYRAAGLRSAHSQDGVDCGYQTLYSFLVIYQPEVKPLRIMAVLRGQRNIKRILKNRS
jgi:hypothetical protein